MFGGHVRAMVSKTQTNQKQMKKNPYEGVTFLSQVAHSVILGNLIFFNGKLYLEAVYVRIQAGKQNLH